MQANRIWGELRPEPVDECAARWGGTLAERRTAAVQRANEAMADGDLDELAAALEDLSAWTAMREAHEAMREALRRRPLKVAVTGHRGKRFDDPEAVRRRVDKVVDRVQRLHPGARWLHGGCWGVDIWSGQAALSRGAEIGLYLPGVAQSFAARWPERCYRELLRQVVRSSEYRVPVPLYRVANYAIRNRELVKAADVVIAFWDGQSWGGTWQTIRFAREAGKPVFNALNGWRRL